ncbi:MAG: GH36-type glycosyl hydrolase domain-containing protein [Bacteroidota bacterium]
MKLFATEYGYFDRDNGEYVITRPDTPRPWVNVICPGDYGLVVSQSGGGYSWRTHASLNRLTRWEQDLVRDDRGKFLYLRDDETGEYWSATWKPVCRRPDYYQVAHGMGYTVFTVVNGGIRSRMTVFVPPDDPVEIWAVELANESDRPRRLSLFTYLEWCLGVAPDWHREFHKVFIETGFAPEQEVFWARKRLWELPNGRGQHWNRDWEYRAFHAASLPVAGFEGDKESFLGMYGSPARPRAVERGSLKNGCGRWGDAVASLHNRIALNSGETAQLHYILGAVAKEEPTDPEQLAAKYRSAGAAAEALVETKAFWGRLLSTTEVKTPDTGLDLMHNTWLKYQAVSGHLWGRTAYYQTGGAYGFRDQLQASQIFLYIAPDQTARQIKLHAAHQFTEGRVLHWWHPLLEQGLENRISDNLLWLPFVTAKYLKETGDLAFLAEKIPYRDGGPATIYEHCCRAVDCALGRRSPRGLPLIGDGDWNDGLNAVGTEGKGESIWLAHFLCGVLKDFAVVAEKAGDRERAAGYRAEAARLKEAANQYGWDGEWYARAFRDDGRPVGSKSCAEGRIFLNAQTWAILCDVAEGERARAAFAAAERHLFRQYGPLLLHPAYTEPDPGIGYLSRYAAGVRENGGVYTHAACWAVMAAAKMARRDRAYALFRSFLPPHRGMEPDLYKAEPYVTPGNVDGPDSPHFGRGGWTWYTGSAAWAFLAAAEGILGIAADWEGLRISPAIPDDWDGFTFTRPYQNAVYRITCSRAGSSPGLEIVVDGRRIEGNIIPPHRDGMTHEVAVLLAPARGRGDAEGRY